MLVSELPKDAHDLAKHASLIVSTLRQKGIGEGMVDGREHEKVPMTANKHMHSLGMRMRNLHNQCRGRRRSSMGEVVESTHE